MSNLKISAMICDLREVNEEILKQYETVSIETMLMYTSEESQVLLNQYHVQIEAMIMEKLDKDVNPVECNGTFTLKPGSARQQKTCLVVNGRLLLKPGCQDALSDYVKLIVNGEVIYPESLGPFLAPKLVCNGRELPYSDNAVFVDGTLCADHVFVLRAKENSQYYTTGKVLFLDSGADYQKLREKQVSITAGSALIRESALDYVLGLLNDGCSVTSLPDNCTYQNNNLVIDKDFLSQYGLAVCVDGNVQVTDADGLKGLNFLEVTGTVTLREKDKPAFLSVCKKYGHLEVFKGRLVQDLQHILIDRGILNASPEGLSVCDCINVTISEDVSPDLILERLTLTDCINIVCPKSLMGVIPLIATDYIKLSTTDKEPLKEDGSVHIEAMKYKM